MTSAKPLMDEPARGLLLRLVVEKSKAGDPCAQAAAVAVARSGLRLHPLDIPKMARFVEANFDRLGDAASGAEVSAAPDLRDPAAWTAAKPPERVEFIRRLRIEDPAAGRALLERHLPKERGEDHRVRLLRSLTPRLGPDDIDFLLDWTDDASDRVRYAAKYLLARIRGSGFARTRFEELRTLIAVERTGGGSDRLRLNTTRYKYATEVFPEIDLAALEEALGMDRRAMVEAAAGDRELLVGLALSAYGSGDAGLAAHVARAHLPDLWTQFLDAGWERFGLFDRAARDAWCRAVFVPTAVLKVETKTVEHKRQGLFTQARQLGWSRTVKVPVSSRTVLMEAELEALFQMLEGPLPADVAAAVLENAEVAGIVAQTPALSLRPLAALMPPAVAPALRRHLSAANTPEMDRAMLLADVLDALRPPTEEHGR